MNLPGGDDERASPPDAGGGEGAAGQAAGELSRGLGLSLLVSYGLGVTVGAGIYVLVGTAAARAGIHAPVAFIIAAAIMALSAASFAELSTRFPVSAGEAAYVLEGLKSRHLSLAVGGLVIVAGIVSAAAIARGASGYLGVFLPLPDAVLIAFVVLSMGAVAAWGIREAAWLAAIMTVIEIAGLLVIIGAGFWHDPGALSDLPKAFEGLADRAAWPTVFSASLIAFFAFIGFESMVNVAEEVRRPQRTLPLAIAITVLLTTLLYVLVVWVVIRTIPREDLAAAQAPLSLAFEHLTGASPLILAAIAVFATANGVIVQMIMASRVIYGLARQGSLPRVLGSVSKLTHTPLLATALTIALVLILAIGVPIDRLADMTSRVMLLIFALVNTALAALKIRHEGEPPPLDLPLAVPVGGALSCLALLVADLWG